MKKLFLTLSLAACGAFAISCGGPRTPRAEESLSSDKIPPGTRATANIDGQGFDATYIREDVMLNHDEHGTNLQNPNRPAGVSDTLKTNQKSAVPNHE